MHDPVALAHVLDPTLLETVAGHVEVDCSWGAGRGRTNADLRGRSGREPNASVAVGLDVGRFVELLLDRLASLDRALSGSLD